MSSYLNFYLLPKSKVDDKEAKPMLFISYSRGSGIYQSFYETLHPAYTGSEEKYTELTPEMVKRVIDSIQKDIKDTEDTLSSRVEAYKAMMDKVPEEAIDDFVSTKEYIKELKQDLTSVLGIYDWVSELEYSAFAKVFINID